MYVGNASNTSSRKKVCKGIDYTNIPPEVAIEAPAEEALLRE
jgi:hypothetical protein